MGEAHRAKQELASGQRDLDAAKRAVEAAQHDMEAAKEAAKQAQKQADLVEESLRPATDLIEMYRNVHDHLKEASTASACIVTMVSFFVNAGRLPMTELQDLKSRPEDL